MNSTGRTLQELLRHEQFMRRLARSLVCAEGDADDLVQETWLKAVEHPPESRGKTIGWLGTVMRNLARDRSLGASRREKREAAAARAETTPPLQQVIERQELQRKIVEALGRIPEPHASAIVLRFFDGLPPREIARRVDVPVETVKKRLTRGLGELREELDGSFAGGRAAWTAALPALLGPPAAAAASVVLGTLFASPAAKAACALLLVGAGAFFVVRNWPHAEAPPPAAPAAAPRIAVADTPPPAPAPPPIVPAPYREEEPRPARSVPSGETVTVEVIERATGKPVEGATVFYFVLSELISAMKTEGKEIFADQEASIRRFAHPLVTDASGRVEVPKSAKTPTLIARSGKLEGSLKLMEHRREEEPPFRIVLMPPRILRVAVVDPAGIPIAGETVVFRMSGNVWAQAKSEGAGIATIVLNAECQIAADGTPAGVPIEVAIPGVGLDAAAPIDLRAPLAEPVRLVLAPTGRMVIELSHQDGKVVTDAIEVKVSPGEPIGREWNDFEKPRFPADGGRVVIDRVGLGRRYKLEAELEARGLLAASEVAGPASAGEEVRATLVLGPPAASKDSFVVGRLVAEDRSPVALADLGVRISARWAGTSSGSGGNAVTDAEGRFRVRISGDFYPAAERAHRELCLLDAGAGKRMARIDLTRALPPGETDLGDVVFALLPLVCRGVVVDDAGSPVPGATIHLGRMPPVDRDVGYAEALLPDDPGVKEVSDSEGRFEIRRASSEAQLVATAVKDDVGSESVSFARGSEALRLVLPRAAAMAGRILLDPGIPTALIRVAISDGTAAGAVALEDGTDVPLTREGSFGRKGLTSGTASVTVWAFGRFEPLLVLGGIPAPRGATTRDPRLNPLDLRGKLRVATLTLVDPEDRPVTDAMIVRVGGLPGVVMEDAFMARRGSPMVILGPAPIDLAVEAAGFRRTLVPNVDADRKVVLSRGIRVGLRLEGALPALEDGIVIEALVSQPFDDPAQAPGGVSYVRRLYQEGFPVVVLMSDGPRLFPDRVTAELQPTGTGVAFLPGPGSFKLQLTRSRSSSRMPAIRSSRSRLHLRRRWARR